MNYLWNVSQPPFLCNDNIAPIDYRINARTQNPCSSSPAYVTVIPVNSRKGIKYEWLTHWSRTMHICVSKLTIIVSDDGLSSRRRQAIIWTNAGLLLIWPLGTNFTEILIEIHTFPFKKMHLKMSSGKRRPFCLGLNVLILYAIHILWTRWQFNHCQTLSWLRYINGDRS